MDQLHRRFSDEQIKVLFRGYYQGLLSTAELRDMLSIEKLGSLLCSSSTGKILTVRNVSSIVRQLKPEISV